MHRLGRPPSCAAVLLNFARHRLSRYAERLLSIGLWDLDGCGTMVGMRIASSWYSSESCAVMSGGELLPGLVEHQEARGRATAFAPLTPASAHWTPASEKSWEKVVPCPRAAREAQQMCQERSTLAATRVREGCCRANLSSHYSPKMI